MKLILQQVAVQGPARMKYLSPNAAATLRLIEKETGGLVYNELWQDGVGVLRARRFHPERPRPGYAPNQFGIGLDLDLRASLAKKGMSYGNLLRAMTENGWYCYRRDGEAGGGAEHFDYFGEHGLRYLMKTTLDPLTWPRAAEERIYDLHGTQFQLTLPQVQAGLAELHLYAGKLSGEHDDYTREAILALQRTWGLAEDGTVSTTVCRLVAVLTADLEIQPAPR